jgi:stromal membrane-associated protein
MPGATGGFTSGNNAPPKVSADEDFGGWSSAAPISPPVGTAPAPAKPAGGFAASEDLFGNVWE